MVDMGIVQGNAEQALPRVIGKDTVYIHTNITPITKDAEGNPIEGLYQYNEIQYDKDEYIEILAQKNEDLEDELTSTQIAMCEVYEMLG